MLRPSLGLLGLLLLLGACSDAPPPASPGDILADETTSALSAQVEKDLHSHIAVLASDEFEGRAPATAGEELTVNYLKEQFAALGLHPGNRGEWFQEVPVTGVTSSSYVVMQVTGDGYSRDLVYGVDMMVATSQQVAVMLVHQGQR